MLLDAGRLWGFIGVELAFAGRLLAPLATQAVSKLSAPLGIARWRVAWLVRRSTGLTFPWREYRKWLKELQESDFLSPVEDAAPALALRLDDALLAAGPVWARKPGRTSAALTLVESTYAALLHVLEKGSVTELRESWSRERNATVIARLTEIAQGRGGWGNLSGDDLAIYLKRRSWERRAIRLEAVGVDGSLRARVVEALAVSPPIIARGTVRTIVGPFGAGKTETAEAWHLACIDRLDSQADDDALPVWLYARDLRGDSLERSVLLNIGDEKLLRTRGAAVVVDGLDEVDRATAEAIARDARILVATNSRSSVLMTARPHVLPPDDADLEPSKLQEAQMRELLEIFGVANQSVYGWTPALKESAKRPFFALAAARALADGKQLGGQATLVRNLVELALGRGTSQGLVTEKELYDFLVEVAAQMTETGGGLSGSTYQREQRALSTRILQRSPKGELQFSLPIFEQWFASQRLLEATPLPTTPFESPGMFEKWRWAIAVATSGGDDAKVDEILSATTSLNPGAAGWILGQVGSGVPAPDVRLSGTFETTSSRVLRATRAWVDSIGPLAPWCFPLSTPQERIRLGVKVTSDGWLTRGWGRTPPTSDVVELLPDRAHPWGDPDPDWLALGGGYPPAGGAWPWLLVRHDISRHTLRILESEKPLGGPRGVWHDELRYHQCRVLADEHTVYHRPMDRTALSDKVEFLLRQVPDVDKTNFVFGRQSISGPELRALGEWLASLETSMIERPAPVADLEFPTSGWTWGFFSDARVAEYVAEVYGNASQAYEEVADTVFSKFDWTLGYGAYRPVGLLGEVRRKTAASWEGQPVLHYREFPMELMTRLAEDGGFQFSSNRRAAIRLVIDSEDDHTFLPFDEYDSHLRDWLSANPRQGPFGSLSSGSSILDLNSNRPASAIAAKNLFSDLKALGLGDGTFPQLR